MAATGKVRDGKGGWLGKAFAFLVSIVLAVGLVPIAAQADEPVGDVAGEASQEDAPSIEGQAIVLYRVPDDASSEGGIQLFSSDANADVDAAPLEAQGLSVRQTWDFSAVDSAAQTRSARSLSNETEDALAEEDSTDSIPTGSDVRIALVERAGTSTEQLIEELSALGFVEAVQPNYVRSADSTLFNDALYDDYQYSLQGADGGGIDLEAALGAYAPSPEGENIVAVVDTGVDASHPDLAASMWSKPAELDMLPGAEGSPGYDFGDNDDDPTPYDTGMASHGTHCAGIIAAQSNNSEGIAGVAQSTKIMALKCSVDGAAAGDMSDSAIISSYQYIVAAKLAGQNVVAVNNSWAGPAYSPVLDYLINQAGRSGIMSFVAAGNDYTDTSSRYRSTVGLESPYAIVIASSNQLNDLSDFSNYNETQVDAAAPGSTILSTVSTRDAATYFDAGISHDTGKELAYWKDFSEAGEYTIEAYLPGENEDYVKMDDELFAQAVMCTQEEDGLRVAIDGSVLLEHDISPFMVEVRISWEVDNPFKGSSLSGSDFAATAGLALATEDKQSGDLASWRLEIAGDEGENLSPSPSGEVSLDNVINTSTAGFTLADIDAESDMLSMCVGVSLSTGSWVPGVSGGEAGSSSGDDGSMVAGCIVENVGIGRITGDDSAYAPYAYMSGTSMATPVTCGSYALMTSLLPDEDPLELRGRLLGTADAMNVSPGVMGERSTATDGRIDLAAAVSTDEQSANANTWSVSADVQEGTAVLHGYALKDASVTIDGEPAEVVDAAEDGSWLTVEVPAAAFDGARHRIDVTDAQSGRVHKASYTLPVAETPDTPASGTALERVMDTPEVEGMAAVGTLVGAANGVYYADPDGGYLYYCADPQADGAAWEQRSVPGAPLEDEGLAHVSATLEYVYLDGEIYAFCARSELDDEGNRDQAVYAATYSIADDAWTPYQLVGRIEGDANSTLVGFSVAAYAGKVYCYSGITVARTIEDEENPGETTTVRAAQMMWAQLAADGSGFEVEQFASDATAGIALYDVVAFSEGIVGLGVDGDGSLHAVEYDAAEGTWSDGGVIADGPVFDGDSIRDFASVMKAAAGSGILISGFSWEGLGDTSLIARGEDGWEWRALGSFGASSSEGITVSSGGMAGDVLYLVGIDARTDAAGSQGGVYVLPDEAAARLSGLDRTAAASAGEGGTATVSAPFAEAGASATVRVSDTATWTASPAQGYAFAGWYDASGALVSADATYAAPVMGDVALEARFSPSSEQSPADEGPKADGTLKGLASTGDAAPVLPIACVVACAAGIAACAARTAGRNR